MAHVSHGMDSVLSVWVALPPGTADVSLLKACLDLAEPFLDLRYGDAADRLRLVARAEEADLLPATVCVDLDDAETLGGITDGLPPGSRVVLCPAVHEFRPGRETVTQLKAAGLVVGWESGSIADARRGLEAGADFLMGSGFEAAGFVSAKSSLVLAQELARAYALPFIMRGGLGPMGAAAVKALGAAGCVLESQVLLAEESPVPPGLRAILNSSSPTDTAMVGESLGAPYRALTTGGRAAYRELVAAENDLLLSDLPDSQRLSRFRELIRKHARVGFGPEAKLPPVGQGIAFAREFAARGLGVRAIVREYQSTAVACLSRVKRRFPFVAGSSLAERHGVELPVVQGPMAVVSSRPAFARAVSDAGGVPFLSTVGLSPDESRKALADAKESLEDRPFGVGLLGFAGAQTLGLDDLAEAGARFAVVAGGSAEDARKLGSIGVTAYLHAPSGSHVADFLDARVPGIVLEGGEAGGHVGALGSLVLWEIGAREVLQRDDVGDLGVLFAGGIADARGALAAAVFAAALEERGVATGLQLGTAYLVTEEAARTGAVSDLYRQTALLCLETVVTGRSVNLPARWARTPSALAILQAEAVADGEGADLRERKEAVERRALDHLSAAVAGSGLADDAEEAEAAAMCGQAIALLSEGTTIAELHRSVTSDAQVLAGELRTRARAEIPGDAVAIVGMGCLFPGAENLEGYWQALLECRPAFRDVPNDRWDPDIFYDSTHQARDKSASKLGAFVDGFQKDPVRFRIPPVSAPAIDRLQFMALEVAAQTLQDAGYLERDFPREKTGVILGNSMGGELAVQYGMRIHTAEYVRAVRSSPEFQALPEEQQRAITEHAEAVVAEGKPDFTEDSCPGTLGSIIAGRICNHFDLGGVSYTLDGACASSLAAIHTAILGLQSGQYDMALAGGADARMDPSTYVMFSNLGVLSDRGCFPFEEQADGFVMGEGCGMVLLKRLADARRDGDRIYAVIRCTGSSSDGAVKGITAPDPDGQIMAMRRAYEGMPFGPARVSYVEGHGTGTWNGDRVELTSLHAIFETDDIPPRSVALGSVKSMIGHLKTAAGTAGVIKAALALHNRKRLPTAVSGEPRKGFDWEHSPFYLIDKPEDWPDEGHPRMAAVNSFGFGGVNFHTVLEEAPAGDDGSVGSGSEGCLLVLRAEDREALKDLCREVRARLSHGRTPVHEMARDLWNRRSPDGPTLAVVAPDRAGLVGRLEKAQDAVGDPDRSYYTSAQGIYFGVERVAAGDSVAFVYPGQGSQYLNMGGDLRTAYPFLEGIFRDVDKSVRRWSGKSILPLLFAPDDADEEQLDELRAKLVQTDHNHPALMAMWVALTTFLRRAGIRPAAAAGHSVGEYGALYAGGAFGLDTAVSVTTLRGAKVHDHAYRAGAMAAVGAHAERVEEVIAEAEGLLTVANKNCPAQTVVSGDIEAIEEALERFRAMGVHCSRIPVSSAFHSPLMQSCVEPFRLAMEMVPVREPSIPVQCNVTGKAYAAGEGFEARVRDALAQHLVKPVEFVSNVESMYEAGARLFIEVGPGSTLCSFIDNVLGDRPHWTFPTNVSRVSPSRQLLHVLAFCAARGLDVDLDSVIAGGSQPLRRSRSALHHPVAGEPAATVSATAPDLVSEALEGAEAGDVARYLAERSGFLADLVRVDFEHFAGTTSAPARQDEGSGDDDSVAGTVVSVVARRTGYPEDVIDIDLDVEAELGLDSIKQTEIVRELEETLDVRLEAPAESGAQRVTTLRDLIRRFRNLLGERTAGEPAGQAAAAEAAAESEDWNLDCHRYVCALRERPLPADVDLQNLKGRRVVLLGPPDGVRESMLGHLAEAGAAATVLELDSADAMLPDDVEMLVDFSSLGETLLPGENEVDEWWRDTSERAAAMLRVVKEFVRVARNAEAAKPTWVEVTSLGGDLGAESPHESSAGAGVGLALSRCLFADHPDLVDVLYLDFAPGRDHRDVAQTVVRELAAERVHNEIGFRDGKRYEIRWQVEDRLLADDEALPAGDSVVLAVGGARGITASVCRELAARRGCRFIVVGRSEVPAIGEGENRSPVTFEDARDAILEEAAALGEKVVPREVEREAWRRVWAHERRTNMEALSDFGESAEYRQCDVTEIDAVRDLVRSVMEDYGRIDVVVSGVGALVEQTIEEFDDAHLVAGFRPKALGTANLLAALADASPRVFVNVTSVVGRWGHMGLAAYAVGHVTSTLMVAGMRAKRPGRWLNLFYGPWLEVGMTRLGSTMERVHDSGGAFVSREDGNEYFLWELASEGPQTTAFRGREPFGVLAAVAASDRERHPLLDSVTHPEPGLAEGRVVFDPATNRLVSGHKVGLEPILPGTVAMEMMAQTAATLLDSDLELTDIEELELQRAVRFPRGEARELRTRARSVARAGEGVWFSAELYSLFAPPHGGEPQETQHAVCRLRMGERAAAPRPSLVVAKSGLGDCSVELDEFWNTAIALGREGVFRNIRSLSSLTTETVSGEVLAQTVAEMGAFSLTGNPVRLDGVFYIASLPDILLTRNASHYLHSVRRLRFFRSDDPTEGRFCLAESVPETDRSFVNEIEGIGTMGRVLEKIEGAVSVRADKIDGDHLDLPVIDDLRWNPQRRTVARLIGLDGPLSLAEIRVSVVAEALLGGDSEALADWLNDSEMAALEELRHERRRSHWLAGRVAAKEAVRSLLGDDAPPVSRIVIESGPTGAPVVRLVERETPEGLSVSLAHSEDSACAAATLVGPVGIDIELATLDIGKIADRFTTHGEAERMQAATGEMRMPVLMSLWVMKEAGLKALGAERYAMTDLLLESMREDGRFVVADFSTQDGESLTAAALHSHNYFYSVATTRSDDDSDKSAGNAG